MLSSSKHGTTDAVKTSQQVRMTTKNLQKTYPQSFMDQGRPDWDPSYLNSYWLLMDSGNRSSG